MEMFTQVTAAWLHLTKIKTKNELIGEVIGLLQSPAKRVLAALLHHHEQNRLQVQQLKRQHQQRNNLEPADRKCKMG